VLFVCCLIVVPLPPGENPFAVNNNNNKINKMLLCLKAHDKWMPAYCMLIFNGASESSVCGLKPTYGFNRCLEEIRVSTGWAMFEVIVL
jgi:hypothetical protein